MVCMCAYTQRCTALIPWYRQSFLTHGTIGKQLEQSNAQKFDLRHANTRASRQPVLQHVVVSVVFDSGICQGKEQRKRKSRGGCTAIASRHHGGHAAGRRRSRLRVHVLPQLNVVTRCDPRRRFFVCFREARFARCRVLTELVGQVVWARGCRCDELWYVVRAFLVRDLHGTLANSIEKAVVIGCWRACGRTWCWTGIPKPTIPSTPLKSGELQSVIAPNLVSTK